ncbi:MAG: RNA 2',3'-cyclic phosphodiesterase [Planctomycetes bacterium]|nr:RNA 2',3'-cyclic phosphodiesterase [Planctomycetota bacterium]
MRTLRLFVAAYPPVEAAQRWLRAAAAILPPSVRAAPPEQVHVTLVFLGDRDERELPDIRESIARSVTGFSPVACQADRLSMLPERGPPRLLAAMLSVDPGLLEIQRRLAQRLATDRSRKERFLPHATLARFAGRQVERTDQRLVDEPFRIQELRLMRSRLLAGGAEHELDKVFDLHPQ